MIRLLPPVVLALVLSPLCPAQEEPAPAPSPRALRTDEWGKWERLGSTTLSPDGRWIAYEVSRVDGSRELAVRVIATDATETFDEGRGAQFSADGKWLAYSIGYSEEEREKLEKKKSPVENKLGLFDLVTGEKSEIERVSSFRFSEAGDFLAMRRYAAKGEKGGADLVVRDMATGRDTHFGRVGDFAWSEVGALLAMTIDAPDKAGNGVRVYDAAARRLDTLDSADAEYHRLEWHEDAADLAVLREKAFEEDEDTTHAVLAWRGLDGDAPRATLYDPLAEATFPGDQRIVTHAGLAWSDDGSALFFGLKPWEHRPAELDETSEEAAEEPEKPSDPVTTEEPAKPTDPAATEEPAKPAAQGEQDEPGKTLRESLDDPAGVEVWHADDIDILPRQKKTLSADENESALTALWLEDRSLVTLEDQLVEEVRLLEGQRLALGSDETPYEEEQRFSATMADVYVVDARSGTREKLLERVRWYFGGDPLGKRFLFVRDDQIHAYDLETRSITNLTGQVDVPFINQEMSSLTEEKPPYGIVGWMADGRHVILSSRYDLWAFALDGSHVDRLTHGTDERIRHQRVVLDREKEEFVDPAGGFYVSLYGDTTKKSGYGRLDFGSPVERLVWKDARVSGLERAENADVYTFVEQTYADSPDVFAGGPKLANAKQLSATNAFQDDYLWGKSELVDFESANGDALQGALFYPAGYEPGKQYPMIVYIYELRSQVLHQYGSPSERNPYSTQVFTNEGYFVFQPDIVYRAQNPGLSAVECVVPAVRKMLGTGMIDPQRVGLVGHSWGAYQTAFLVTQTDLFAAGVAGAPLTNMMSMSMSIYWNSGQTDAYIFHESQGRMDRPFWNDLDTYIANSPIFNIEDLDTPLLVTFGDKDGAVDWHQGIEMYNAARLARKPLVMLVYPGENHGLRKKPNQVDYHHRVREWFGHYVRGDEAPKWITEGQSWLERKKELEAFEKVRKGGKKSKAKETEGDE